MQCSAQHQAVRHHTISTDGAARQAGCSGPTGPCVTARRRRQSSVGQVRECTGPAMPQHTYAQRAHNTHSPARLPVPVGRHPGLLPFGNSAFGTPHHTTPHHTTPHHTTPHHTTPHHTTPHHTTPHHTTPHHTTPHHTTPHHTTPHHTTPHHTTPHHTTPHHTTPHHTTPTVWTPEMTVWVFKGRRDNHRPIGPCTILGFRPGSNNQPRNHACPFQKKIIIIHNTRVGSKHLSELKSSQTSVHRGAQKFIMCNKLCMMHHNSKW